jgi:N-methylhydantoinase A
MLHRPVWFDDRAPTSAAIYDRSKLAPGHVFVGPAIVEQMDTTTVVFPGDRVRVDAQENLVIEVAA